MHADHDCVGRDDGFTLIELLIVVIILGVLAGIVVYAVGGTGDTASSNACKAEAKEFDSAYIAYRANHRTQTVPGSPVVLNMAATLYSDGQLSKSTLQFSDQGQAGPKWTFNNALTDTSAC
jgi:prepilin-type N-terminal cleavage/methylation domain-containing protein